MDFNKYKNFKYYIIKVALKQLGLIFKNNDLLHEFCDSKKTDPRVRMRVLEIAFELYLRYGAYFTVTSIGRTAKSNIKIYGYDQASPHREMPSRGIDGYPSVYSIEIVCFLKNYYSAYMDIGRYYSLLDHDVGAGRHIHIQVPHNLYINKKLYPEQKEDT